MIRVLLVASDYGLLRGICGCLQGEPDLEVVGVGRTAEDAVHLASMLRPDAVVLASDAAGGSAPDTVARLRGAWRGVRVVVVAPDDAAALPSPSGDAVVQQAALSRQLATTLRSVPRVA